MNLRAFSVNNPELDKLESDLVHKLRKALQNSKSANDRRMVLNIEDPNQEEDLLSYFSEPDEIDVPQFCTMLRLSPGKDVQHINDTLFNKSRFTISDLNNTELDTAAIYQSHYYFSASGNFITTNLPGNITVQRLQTYVNWHTGGLYEIFPIVEKSKISQLADIRNITVSDPVSEAKRPVKGVENTKKTVFNLAAIALDAVKNMLTDTTELDDLELSQMISAKLVIEFAKPKKADDETLQKAYAALLKPVADLEHFSIKTRDNKTVAKGKDILRMKTVKIDSTEGGKPNENTIRQEMARFLLELKHETKASG